LSSEKSLGSQKQVFDTTKLLSRRELPENTAQKPEKVPNSRIILTPVLFGDNFTKENLLSFSPEEYRRMSLIMEINLTGFYLINFYLSRFFYKFSNMKFIHP